jgi:serine kinase of HPr protein (carbohydrate metabolism regulator)
MEKSLGPSSNASSASAVSANCVALGEQGVLIRGGSGAGKSSLALALVEAWRGRGDFARIVGDDRVLVRIRGGRALISPHRAIAGRSEWRGIGLIEQDYEDCAVLALIVDLESPAARADVPRLPEAEQLCGEFQGVNGVPLLRLPERETERSVAAIMAFLHKISSK